MRFFNFLLIYSFIIIIYCNLLIADSYNKSLDYFIEQEIKHLMTIQDSDSIYSIDGIDISRLNLSNDEKILWKRSQEAQKSNNIKLKNIEKIMQINYMVGSYPPYIIKPNTSNNSLSDNDFNYLKMAFYCTQQGDVNCLRALLDYKVDINSVDQAGDTLLIKAILSNQIDTLRLLLARGANVNIKDKEESTPLDLAIIKGNIHIIESLKAMDSEDKIKDKFGKTAKDYIKLKK